MPVSLADVSIRMAFGKACRETRLQLDLTQQGLAEAVGVSRGYISRLELGQVNLTVDLVERIAGKLGQRLELVVTPPIFVAARLPHDRVHAWCVEATARRLQAAGWRVAREVEVAAGRAHGWIDIVAFHPDTRTLLVIEVKTRLDDVGGLERQIRWYERRAIETATRLGWVPIRSGTWVIGIASDEFEKVLAQQRGWFDAEYPGRATHMLDVSRGLVPPTERAIGLIDPGSKRRDWLMRTRLDGRRSTLPYRDYADAARRLSR